MMIREERPYSMFLMLSVAFMLVCLASLGSCREINNIDNFAFETDENPNADQSGGRSEYDVRDKFLQAMMTGVESEGKASERRSVTKKSINYEQEIKSLKQELAEQKKQNEEKLKSILQQVDALARQDAKIMKLVGSTGQEDGVRIGAQSSGAKSDADVITTGGIHYIRWGRNTCPSTAFELYRGYTAGSYYSNNKGGVNTLCLHDDPQWGASGDTSSSANYISGAEYYFSSTPFSTVNNGGNGLHWHDVPCIVCHTPVRSNQIMIPARRSCPAGWTFEYSGYIVSDSTGSYSRSDFICLDEAPEVMIAGSEVKYGLFLSNVRVSCGSLACPKYVSGRPIACVVCTK